MQAQGINAIESFKPSWYNNMTLESTDAQYKYHKYTYCGLVIYENFEHTHFNATRVMEQVILKDDEGDDSKAISDRVRNIMKGKFFAPMNEQHPEWFFSRGGKGSSKYGFGGQYIQWNLFNTFIEAARTGATMYLECGIEIPIVKSGYLYFCKPEKKEKCLDTDTVKVGRTWSWEQRHSSYGKRTIEYRVVRTNDMYTYEPLMQKAVEQFLAHDTIKGKEYYILPEGDEYEDSWRRMNDLFDVLGETYESENKIDELEKLLERVTEPSMREQYEALIGKEKHELQRLNYELSHLQ